MEKSGGGNPLEDLHAKRIGGTVLVWVLNPHDVGIAQDIAKTLCRSVGLDSEASLMTMAEVSEKSSGLLAPEAGGLLVLSPRGAGISVHAVDVMRGDAHKAEPCVRQLLV